MNPQRQTAGAITRDDSAKLIAQNKILLRVCFVALVLLGPVFVAGYFVGSTNAARLPMNSPQIVADTRSAPSQAKTSVRRAVSPEDSPAGQPVLHGTYLQVAATPQHQAFLARLNQNGFHAVALEIPTMPGTYRVLIGPVEEGTLSQMRDELEGKGLPGKSAIPRVYR